MTVLDLQPDWRITQIYPADPGANFVPIDAGQEQFFPLTAGRPQRYMEGKGVIKVSATKSLVRTSRIRSTSTTRGEGRPSSMKLIK